mmetsp:Transcript_11420/g.23372  ORF Transcript_11420/g.23372 Transcript_11420/m.23372 type:complete len:423 (+) Transcript_11420:355-1623(+)
MERSIFPFSSFPSSFPSSFTSSFTSSAPFQTFLSENEGTYSLLFACITFIHPSTTAVFTNPLISSSLLIASCCAHLALAFLASNWYENPLSLANCIPILFPIFFIPPSIVFFICFPKPLNMVFLGDGRTFPNPTKVCFILSLFLTGRFVSSASDDSEELLPNRPPNFVIPLDLFFPDSTGGGASVISPPPPSNSKTPSSSIVNGDCPTGDETKDILEGVALPSSASFPSLLLPLRSVWTFNKTVGFNVLVAGLAAPLSRGDTGMGEDAIIVLGGASLGSSSLTVFGEAFFGIFWKRLPKTLFGLATGFGTAACCDESFSFFSTSPPAFASSSASTSGRSSPLVSSLASSLWLGLPTPKDPKPLVRMFVGLLSLFLKAVRLLVLVLSPSVGVGLFFPASPLKKVFAFSLFLPFSFFPPSFRVL